MNFHLILSLLWLSCALLPIAVEADSPALFENTQTLPAAYQGRFRPLESASRLWLYDHYHLQNLKKEHLKIFDTEDKEALTLNWKMHFMGHVPYDDAPFFWIHYASLKSILNLNLQQTRYSYNELAEAIYHNKETNLKLIKRLLVYQFAQAYRSSFNRSRSKKIELKELASGLWVSLQDDNLILAATPTHMPWHNLHPGMLLTQTPIDLELVENEDKSLIDEFLQLYQMMQQYAENDPLKQRNQHRQFEDTLQLLEQQKTIPSKIAQQLESAFPLSTRLKNAGMTLKMLPSRFNENDWLSLHALNEIIYDQQVEKMVPAKNFTIFSDESFDQLRYSYWELETAVLKFYDPNNISENRALSLSLKKIILKFTKAYHKAYSNIADIAYKEAAEKSLSYPSMWQLKAETVYYQFPLIEICVVCYAAALFFYSGASILKQPLLHFLGYSTLLLAFAIHTAILVLRCLILQRPPVSNMFETVIYVPWAAMVMGWLMLVFFKNGVTLLAASIASLGLLILLKLTLLDSRLENVQAVLDSQYWLIVHVLMIVGSYGVFVVCGILGHFYFLVLAKQREENAKTRFIAHCILQTMYIGVALLIPGTLLGGVWAAESWGRFWDWDPKESWAFISACTYLLIIHSHIFHKIYNFGLAIGSIIGLMAISFTWYGVNYLLGTGLHSYGFGKGGEYYYFSYLIGESVFIVLVNIFLNKKNLKFLT